MTLTDGLVQAVWLMSGLAALAIVTDSCAPASPITTYGLPVTAPQPIEVGDPLAECSGACLALNRMRCPEAVSNLGGNSCLVTCIQITRVRTLPLACWTHAEDLAALRTCGSIVCDR